MDSDNGHLVQVTSTNGGYDGLELMSGFEWATFHNVLIQGASRIGIVGSPADTTFSQLVLASNGLTDIYFEGGGNNQFSGFLAVDVGCIVSGSTNHGLVDGTCTISGSDGSSDYPGGSNSNALLRTGTDLANAFLGPWFADDEVNSSDVDGYAGAYPGDTVPFDFVHFANAYRAWARTDGSGAAWDSGAGRIVDWRLRRGNSAAFEVSGDGRTPNQPFVTGAACPSAAAGSRVVTDRHGETYLLNAVELMFDGVGNDDGLCESHEACLYTPNIGAYQGEGVLAPCLFDDAGGTAPVVGVSLYGYLTNGVP